MLLQRALCRSLPKQFPDPPQCLWPRTMQRNTLFRSFRSSPHRRNPQPASSVHAPHAPPPFENVIFGGSVPPRNIVKALLFTGVVMMIAFCFTAGCFAGATILEYENTRNMMLEKARQTKFPWLRRKINASNELTVWEEIRNELQTFWSTLTPGGKVFVPLCALNVLVFALWRVPSMRPTMLTYFCSNPAGRAVCWPMFLSTFSHYSMFHIFANMYVLNSFANAAVLSMGKEQFLAVYLSGGVIASFASILYKAATAQAGLSIGASGAIMAIFAYVCAKYPDTQLNILFLPMVTFSAGAAMKVLMGFDLAGCILGWKFFDHAAHLGGALYGIFWAYFGTELWQKRVPFLTMYHDFRKTK